MHSSATPATRLAIGLAALGRPSYITTDHALAFADRSIEGMRQRTFEVLDAAYEAGIRHVDAARSYGLAENFLATWLAARPHVTDVLVSSKWGYRYVGRWQVEAEVHEVKDHSVKAFQEQWAETQATLGDAVALYQVHSITPESPALRDRPLLDDLARLRDGGVRVGLSTSGPHQADVVEEALAVSVGGTPLFSAVQATWNVLEPSVGAALVDAAAAGWAVMVKEVLANGRLAGSDAPPALVGLATTAGVTADAMAIAAALAQQFKPTVLLGAVSTDQLSSNLASLNLDAAALAPRISVLRQSAEAYWKDRSALPWH